MIIDMLRQVQIPLLAAMLLGGCAAKLVRTIRGGSVDAGLGPTALFPMHLRRPVAMAMCALELGLGLGLIATVGGAGGAGPATCVRLGTGLLFLVATCALLELRAARPDVGCGCFGNFSSSPVGWRTLTRSALLSVAGLTTIGLNPLQPARGVRAVIMLAMLAGELAVIAALSPELGEALVRLGYSEPCELRLVTTERTITALRRSKQWRRYAGVITADEPADSWRELCWRYLVFPGRRGGRPAEVVFAVYLRQRQPVIHAALVDTATGRMLPWPAPPGRRRAGEMIPRRWRSGERAVRPAAGDSAVPDEADSAAADLAVLHGGDIAPAVTVPAARTAATGADDQDGVQSGVQVS